MAFNLEISASWIDSWPVTPGDSGDSKAACSHQCDSLSCTPGSQAVQGPDLQERIHTPVCLSRSLRAAPVLRGGCGEGKQRAREKDWSVLHTTCSSTQSPWGWSYLWIQNNLRSSGNGLEKYINILLYYHLKHDLKLWASLIAQLVKKSLPPLQETMVRSLGWEDPLEKG